MTSDTTTHEQTYSNSEGETWLVSRLINLSSTLPSFYVSLTHFTEDLDADRWSSEDREEPLTLRQFAEHMTRIQTADLNYPVILSAEGWLMDGAHRLVKAYMAGHASIKAVQFKQTPEPDWVDETS